ncbi:Oidioi.mRNA.OKI2018_I69.chr1.g1302.t1.cds [Oikopleura dioica]|uniref:Oidioi.mRNA.OKI2018_I69.chr1.g1302.t1.cds n=1 Tax=Oikopleura dioica TaxID=34765 RepID=A0ABN7SR17_OIKDI|nr:Oidioi.mRNA.OKI2018_I69.chr1.g1302.t1.cds [Oikopleura dioica]
MEIFRKIKRTSEGKKLFAIEKISFRIFFAGFDFRLFNKRNRPSGFFYCEFGKIREQRKVFIPNPDDWYKYSYPKSSEESVSDELLILITAVLPLIIYGFCLSFLNSSSKGFSLKMQFKFIFNQIIVYFLTGIVTNLLKQSIQRLRPDFIATCFELDEVQLRKVVAEGFNSSFPGATPSCSASESDLWKSMLSFPSGHSSLAFANFVYLALRVVKIPEKRQLKSGSIVEAFLLTFPLLIVLPAIHISLSRVIENRHHPEDILAGAIVGSLIAITVSQTEDLFAKKNSDEAKYEPAHEISSDNLIPSA